MTFSMMEGSLVQEKGLRMLEELCKKGGKSLVFDVWGAHTGGVGQEWRIGDRVLEGHLLMLTHGGRCDYTIEGRVYRLVPNTLLWMSEGVRNACEQLEGEDYRFTVLRFDVFEGGERWRGGGEGVWGALELEGAGALEARGVMMECVRQFRLGRGGDGAAREVGNGLVVGALGMARRLFMEEGGAGRFDERVEEARRVMGERHGVDVTVEGLAREVGLSVRHFAKLFREQVGVSPKRYLLGCRMDFACFLLSEGGVSVKECGFLLGYSDAFVFSRQFKGIVGVSPSEFRR